MQKDLHILMHLETSGSNKEATLLAFYFQRLYKGYKTLLRKGDMRKYEAHFQAILKAITVLVILVMKLC